MNFLSTIKGHQVETYEEVWILLIAEKAPLFSSNQRILGVSHFMFQIAVDVSLFLLSSVIIIPRFGYYLPYLFISNAVRQFMCRHKYSRIRRCAPIMVYWKNILSYLLIRLKAIIIQVQCFL